MLPRKKVPYVFLDDEEEEPISTMYADAPKIDDDATWCKLDTEWTKAFATIVGEHDSKPMAYDLLLQLAKCAIQETEKSKQAYLKYAYEEMKEPDIEENLQDYRECVLPIYLKANYDNMNKYGVKYSISFAFRWGQSYFNAFQQVIKNGCLYNKKLLADMQVAESFAHNLICLLYRAHKYFQITPGTMDRITLPPYVETHTGNVILFFRDFMILRDFHDYCKRVAMMLTFQKRKYFLNTGVRI